MSSEETPTEVLEKPPHPIKQLVDTVDTKLKGASTAIAGALEEAKAARAAKQEQKETAKAATTAQKKIKVDWAAWKTEVEETLHSEISSLKEELEALKNSYGEYRKYMRNRGYGGEPDDITVDY